MFAVSGRMLTELQAFSSPSVSSHRTCQVPLVFRAFFFRLVLLFKHIVPKSPAPLQRADTHWVAFPHLQSPFRCHSHGEETAKASEARFLVNLGEDKWVVLQRVLQLGAPAA